MKICTLLIIAIALILSTGNSSVMASTLPSSIESPLQALQLLHRLQEGTESSQEVLHRIGHTDFERWAKEGYRLLSARFQENAAGPSRFDSIALFRLVNGDGRERTLSYYVKTKFLVSSIEDIRTVPDAEKSEDLAGL
ncbi:MAG: hypothetical protein AB7F59_06580 [Bdellovibrionales bacterium]